MGAERTLGEVLARIGEVLLELAELEQVMEEQRYDAEGRFRGEAIEELERKRQHRCRGHAGRQAIIARAGVALVGFEDAERLGAGRGPYSADETDIAVGRIDAR